jgi:hypothetical protein
VATRLRLLAALAWAWTVSGCDAGEPPPPPSSPTSPGGTGSGSPQPAPTPPDGGAFPADAAAPDAAQQGCGGVGQVCCPGALSCVSEFTHCDPQIGQCVACGSGGQRCCSEGPPCRGPLFCSAGVCSP